MVQHFRNCIGGISSDTSHVIRSAKCPSRLTLCDRCLTIHSNKSYPNQSVFFHQALTRVGGKRTPLLPGSEKEQRIGTSMRGRYREPVTITTDLMRPNRLFAVSTPHMIRNSGTRFSQVCSEASQTSYEIKFRIASNFDSVATDSVRGLMQHRNLVSHLFSAPS